MPDAFLILGAAIVKSGLKIWLGNDPLAADAGGSVVDVLRAKISGDLELRQAKRFFEDLEVPVANRLRALRAVEFRSIPANEWNAAVFAAGESFDNAGLAAQDLFTRDLDPLFLERQIRVDSRRVTRDLSADGTALYDRLISEGCAHVIEIADKLPHFQVGAFAELLSRDRQILNLISNVLDRIPEKAEGEPQEARFSTAYVRHIATKLDKLELFGLDFESPWYPLSMAYVSLRTDESDEVDGKNIEERLATSQRTVVFGSAGSGKTTVLQWIAVRAARSDFTGALAKLNGHMPFFVRLREYVGQTLPQPEEFIMGVAPMLAPEMPQDWSRTQLRSGRALVLVDGVDELPASERERVVVWIQDLTELFPNARYVVTGRPVAVSADWLDELGFTRTSLEAMPPSLVAAFIRHWHEAVRHRLTDTDECAPLADYESSLLTAIGSDRYLRDLADTPLLAGLLCALNRHVRSQLPRRRGQIYEQALSMFDQRDRARGIATGAIVLDLTVKTHLLADLAFWMVRNGESEVAEDMAIGQLGRSLSSLPGMPNQVDTVYRVLMERSGLLREPASGRVDFVHRTFQEYLAATAAVDENAIGELVRNADDDQWREVVIMAAGQTNQPQTAQLIRDLLSDKAPSGKRVRRRLLAVSCLQEVRSLDRELRQAVEHIIPGLLPPRSMEQAEQLSSAGELLIPLLAQHWHRDARQAATTIRAACLVGGTSALELIGNVISQLSQESIDETLKAEVLRAWQYFDTDHYARRALALLKTDRLTLDDLPRVAHALSHLTFVTYFLINPFTGEADLQGLAGLPRLHTLSVAGVSGAQLLGLSVCQNIRTLRLSDYGSSDLSDLEFPPALESLMISGAFGPISLTGIEQLTSLTHVTLERCLLIGVDRLSELPNLEKVSIRQCGEVNVADLLSDPDVDVDYEAGH